MDERPSNIKMSKENFDNIFGIKVVATAVQDRFEKEIGSMSGDFHKIPNGNNRQVVFDGVESFFFNVIKWQYEHPTAEIFYDVSVETLPNTNIDVSPLINYVSGFIANAESEMLAKNSTMKDDYGNNLMPKPGEGRYEEDSFLNKGTVFVFVVEFEINGSDVFLTYIHFSGNNVNFTFILLIIADGYVPPAEKLKINAVEAVSDYLFGTPRFNPTSQLFGFNSSQNTMASHIITSGKEPDYKNQKFFDVTRQTSWSAHGTNVVAVLDDQDSQKVNVSVSFSNITGSFLEDIPYMANKNISFTKNTFNAPDFSFDFSFKNGSVSFLSSGKYTVDGSKWLKKATTLDNFELLPSKEDNRQQFGIIHSYTGIASYLYDSFMNIKPSFAGRDINIDQVSPAPGQHTGRFTYLSMRFESAPMSLGDYLTNWVAKQVLLQNIELSGESQLDTGDNTWWKFEQPKTIPLVLNNSSSQDSTIFSKIKTHFGDTSDPLTYKYMGFNSTAKVQVTYAIAVWFTAFAGADGYTINLRNDFSYESTRIETSEGCRRHLSTNKWFLNSCVQH